MNYLTQVSQTKTQGVSLRSPIKTRKIKYLKVDKAAKIIKLGTPKPNKRHKHEVFDFTKKSKKSEIFLMSSKNLSNIAVIILGYSKAKIKTFKILCY